MEEAQKNAKQKVLIVHNYYQFPGGEDTVVANEKKMLEEHGHVVVLYSRHNNELKKMTGLRKVLLPFTLIFNVRTYREIRKIIKNEHVDIVHVHNTLILISPSVYYAALICKTPVVQTMHNFRLLCPGGTFYRNGYVCEKCVESGLKFAIKYRCYRESMINTLACVISTKIHRLFGIYGKLNYICLTEFNKRKLLMLKQIRAERVFVKPNFAKRSEEVVPYEQRSDQYVYAGRIDILKGVDVLLEAWKIMGDSSLKLVICGTGPLDKWCTEYIVNNGMMNVELKGFLPNIEVRKIIANSKALILPTKWYEGFPMTIVEAYSVGTPVVTSALGNVGCLNEEGITGSKFMCNNSSELVKSIELISQYSSISETTIKRFEGEYTEKHNYESLLGIYLIVNNNENK